MSEESKDSAEDLLEDEIEIEILEEDFIQFKRLDHFLTRKLPHLSRSFIKNIFNKNLISIYHVDSSSQPKEMKNLELKKMPPIGTKVLIQIPPLPPKVATPENIPLDIIYQDEDIIFVNKPAGMVTHPGAGNFNGTLVNALLYHCPEITKTGALERPGIVHRLDKGTSGILVVAKNRLAMEKLILCFAERKIHRIYQAICTGSPLPLTGTISAPIGRNPGHRLKMAANVKNGKYAETQYNTLEKFEFASFLQLKLKTGRTHQIRVHLSQISHSAILCDSLYGKPKEQINPFNQALKELLINYPHPLLHAKTLGLKHPISGKELEFDAPLPKIFQKVLTLLRNESEK